jgi:prevent-host-death family protein
MDRKINAAAFKARCLALIDEVAETGQPITITKRGKAKVQIVAVREKPKTLFGALEGLVRDRGRHRRPASARSTIWSANGGRSLDSSNDPPARYQHRDLADGGVDKARKERPKSLRGSPRRK